MKNYTLRAVLNYEGDWDGESKDMAQYVFIETYKMLVDITNPLLEGLNSKWHELHPEINNMEEGSAIWNEYNRFIADECNRATEYLRLVTYDLFGYTIKYDLEYNAPIVLSNSKGGKAYFTFLK